MKKIISVLFALAALTFSSVNAAELGSVENLRAEGNELIWDSLEGATGYNIYFDYRYYDTVKGKEQYTLSDNGQYNVVPFDDAGNFGTTNYLNNVDFTVDESTDSTGSQYTENGYTITVHKTCTNVGPGESCLAACPNVYQGAYQELYTKYMSGGACSTSDIVEADAFVSDNTYKCTVPTFSGEVVAQAICVTF
ncbi:hypothetical protein [Granulosicoccus antarcticus]|uniref:Uncharacterized protein n=1 Tax=Granulosicoccus antarcticus IMCC3135 TaxID=1192854 RepID=A0A2Z2NI98_9GAMM|nr:hypothetical protein [Granulosicoccus antarcticus]ASJ70783.1 hypothetical protein IMCC3135_03350 [Granulosicoccus antarcticus IMCC3135]